MRLLLVLMALLLSPGVALASGSILWDTVHKEISDQDKELISFVEKTFDVASSGSAMRPIAGEYAGQRFSPYDFDAKLKGAGGDNEFHLTFDKTNAKDHPWSVLIHKK